MWRRCKLVIVDALGRLQLGCRRQHCRIQVIGGLMSLLDPVRLVDLDRRSGGLPRRWLLLSHRWLRGLLAASRSDGKAVPALMKFAD